MYNDKIFSAFILLIILCSFSGCNTYYDKGIKYINDNKFKEAIEEFNKINPGESKYEESREIINNCYYKIAVDFIRNNHIDSAISILSIINKESNIYTKAKSAISYCNALKSIEKSNQKEFASFLNDILPESEFYIDAQNKMKENEVKNEIKSITFKEFANEFLSNGLTSFEKFITYCDDKILSADCGGPEIVAKKDIVFKYVKEYNRNNNYHFRVSGIEIKKSPNDYILLSFKKKGSTWKIYRFSSTC